MLLHDPQCLWKFEENTLALPVEVLEELDRKKTAPGELGYAARKIHRDLRGLFNDSLLPPPELNGHGKSALSRDLPNGGRLIIVINDYLVSGEISDEGANRLKATLVDLDKMDSRIIASVFFLKEVCQEQRVVLVTKDANMAIKAVALGLEVQDYMNDKVRSNPSRGNKRLELSAEAYDQFIEQHGIELAADKCTGLFLNEYVLLHDGTRYEPARFRGDGLFEALIISADMAIKIPKGIRMQALNHEQRMLMDAILDEDIKLVTCRGKAGTGKTLVSIAMALYQTLGEGNLYERLFITRPHGAHW